MRIEPSQTTEKDKKSRTPPEIPRGKEETARNKNTTDQDRTLRKSRVAQNPHHPGHKGLHMAKGNPREKDSTSVQKTKERESTYHVKKPEKRTGDLLKNAQRKTKTDKAQKNASSVETMHLVGETDENRK